MYNSILMQIPNPFHKLVKDVFYKRFIKSFRMFYKLVEFPVLSKFHNVIAKFAFSFYCYIFFFIPKLIPVCLSFFTNQRLLFYLAGVAARRVFLYFELVICITTMLFFFRIFFQVFRL